MATEQSMQYARRGFSGANRAVRSITDQNIATSKPQATVSSYISDREQPTASRVRSRGYLLPDVTGQKVVQYLYAAETRLD